MIVLPDRSTSEEDMVTHFWNSEDRYQVVTDGRDATCPECGYPERHRVYEDRAETLTLIADGCPSCETSRMPDREVGGDAGAIGTGNSPSPTGQQAPASGDGTEEPSTPPRSTPRHPNRENGSER